MAEFEAVLPVPLDQLHVSPNQARIRDVEKDLDELVENIRIHGQLEPIVIAPDADGYEIILGQRRYLAHQRLGRKTIMAAILTSSVDQVTAKVLSVSENLIRKDLSSKDLIDACTALYRTYGSTKTVAEELGLPYHQVLAYVKFDRLRPELKELVTDGAVDVQTALRVEDAINRGDVDPAVDAVELARTIAPMTRVQQLSFLKSRSRSHADPASAGAEGERHRVKQIVVTLESRVHERLRRWAQARKLSQDQAAGEIIATFLLRDEHARSEHT